MPLPGQISVEIYTSALIGLLGYGVSLVLFVLALREIGAARAGAYFSTAPFIGAFVGLVVLREPWSATLGVAGALMAGGVWLHLTEQTDTETALATPNSLPKAEPK